MSGYSRGVFWALMTAFISVSNDVLTKFIGDRLDVLEVSFFRFLFSMLTVLPFMLRQGCSAFKTQAPRLHFLRAIIGVAAIALYIYALVLLPLAEVTTFSFTQPLFFLPLAALFLKEPIRRNRWLAALIGFLGIIVMVSPGEKSFNFYVLVPMASAALFASLDLLAKKMITNETTLTLLFYFSLGTTIAAFIPALFVWQTPTWEELGFLFLLGAGANLIQVFLFKAFAAADASSLTPFRYVELVFSIAFGFAFFAEIPSFKVLLGAGIIIASTLYLSYAEKIRNKNS